MAKPITLEMVEAMSLDQRKTLHANASKRDTQAAKDILELLAQDDLMSRPPTKVAEAVVPAKPKKMRPVPKAEPEANDETAMEDAEG